MFDTIFIASSIGRSILRGANAAAGRDPGLTVVYVLIVLAVIAGIRYAIYAYRKREAKEELAATPEGRKIPDYDAAMKLYKDKYNLRPTPYGYYELQWGNTAYRMPRNSPWPGEDESSRKLPYEERIKDLTVYAGSNGGWYDY
jgi:hypothetical protein